MMGHTSNKQNLDTFSFLYRLSKSNSSWQVKVPKAMSSSINKMTNIDVKSNVRCDTGITTAAVTPGKQDCNNGVWCDGSSGKGV